MKTDNITVTQGRMKQAFDKGLGKLVENSSQKIVKKEVDKCKIRTGIITKFYPYLDKAEVKLDNDNKKVFCKILHRFGGDLTEYYTPTGDETFDDVRKENCIIPRGDFHCLITNIHDADSEEFLLLGFYSNEELVGLNPATQGNLKLIARGGTNQYWIKFGLDGLDIRLPSKTKIATGDMDSKMEDAEYASLNDVYDKKEVYTKSEVLKLINDLRKELNLETLEEDSL